jgi:hypothetical protein
VPHHRPLAAALVGALLVMSAACADDPGRDVTTDGTTAGADGPPTDDPAALDERTAAVEATVAGIWEAAGVDPADAFVYAHKRTSAASSKPCSHLPEADRWYEDNTSTLNSGVATQAQVVDGAARYLTDEGFTLERYESAADGTSRVGLRGVRGDDVVKLAVETDGNSSLMVASGPCAPSLVTLGPPLYRRVD